MSEIKRVALTTLEPQKVNDKVIKKLCKTVRISVILPESNEDNCPEYNYKDQLAAVVKRKVKPPKDTNGVENGLDPFGDNDDDVRRIALEMEAKYGSGLTKKKRKDRKDDYADIGMGYDESDSFIDNTDGYDEIIPKNVTTLHGGFYVNSGALEFKTDDEATSDASSSASSSSGTSSASESEGEDKQKPKNRKRILETSADSESDTANPAQKEKKPKVQSPTTSMQQAIKKKLFSSSKIQVKKRRPIDPNKKTVKDLLREKREDLNMTVPDELKTVEDNIEKESSKENKKPMNITSVTDAIESVLKQVVEEEEKYDANQNKTPVEVTTNVVLSQNKIDPQISQSKDKDKQNLTRLEKEEIVKLPENLPSDIEVILSKLKEAALNYKGEGKKAFFTQEVNALLLNLEKKSKIVSKSSRVKVYEHLAQYVNCTKDTLIRRARILDLEDHERRLRALQTKLKDCIDSMMPALEENFQLESQKVLQKKFSKECENNEELKNLKMPRRKFIWTEEAKKVLKDAVSVKKRCLVLEGKYKDNLLEEQLVDYLRTNIQPLWPEGWMYLNVIKKILNRMQDHSKSSMHTSNASSSSLNSSSPVKPSKHSNLSITPVTNGKSNPEKMEITNSITVTKVVNNNEVIVVDNPKIINHVKEIDESTEIHLNEHNNKSNESQPNEKSSDFTIHPKKPEVFKPYVEDPTFPQVKKHFNDTDKIRTYQKPQKQNEMFKPYADEVIPVEKTIPDKPYEDVSKYTDKDKEKQAAHSHPEKEFHQEREKNAGYSYQEKDKYTGGHSYPDKEKYGGHSYQEKDKYGGHSYLEKEKQLHQEKNKAAGHSYQEKDKYGRHSSPEKEKQLHQEKDKGTGHSHQEKDKYGGHSYQEKEKQLHQEKDKATGYLYQDKDKYSGHSYPEKEKQLLQEKDKAAGYSYQEKDKAAGYLYQEKDKYSGHSYAKKEKHSYQEKDKLVGHLYQEKDRYGGHSYNEKEKHGGHSYQEKDKHGYSYHNKDKHSGHSHHEKHKHGGHSYHEKDRHGGHSSNDKEKSNSHSAKETPGSAITHYMKKDKYAAHAYSVKDEQVPITYSDKHNPHTYAEKEKHSIHSYAEKEKYIHADTDKHTLHAYSEKEKSTSHSYSDKHGTHTYNEKDKHNSHTYADKHTFRTYSDKDKHPEKDRKIEDKPMIHPEVTDITEKSPNLSKSIEKPTDLSKFQMFKPYSDTPKSLRTVEMSQDATNYSNKSFVPPSDFITARRDVSSTKHRTPTTHTFQGGSSANEVSSIKEDSGVIVQNIPIKDKLPREDTKEAPIGLSTHCQGVKRKLLETYARTTNEINPNNYYSATVPKHSEYLTSSPLVTSKSDGDGQQDIQMVMENLKALQKLSCSPAKNDNSSSSPVSVIAYNKNFASTKTSSSHSHSNRNDINKGDFPGGFQEEFQKAFINPFQQMAASNNKSSYNNGS